MQNVVVVSHTVCTHVESHKNFVGRRAPHPWDGGVVDDLETRISFPWKCFNTYPARKIRKPAGWIPGRGPPTPDQQGTTNPNRTLNNPDHVTLALGLWLRLVGARNKALTL